MAGLELSVKMNSEKARAALSRLSGKQAKQAYASPVRDTAAMVRKGMMAKLPSLLDRPTPYVVKSVNFVVDEEKLTAKILPSYIDRQDPGDPQKILQAQAHGGPRAAKRYEVALRAMGVLPPGWLTVAGRDMATDAYGNLPPAAIKAVLSQLRTARAQGPTDRRRQTQQAVKAGGQYIVIPPGGRTQPGIYHRELMGRGITPVMIFVAGASYRKRVDMDAIAAGLNVQEHFERRLRRRIYNLAEGRDQ